jgi:hypothetical protein
MHLLWHVSNQCVNVLLNISDSISTHLVHYKTKTDSKIGFGFANICPQIKTTGNVGKITRNFSTGPYRFAINKNAFTVSRMLLIT